MDTRVITTTPPPPILKEEEEREAEAEDTKEEEQDNTTKIKDTKQNIRPAPLSQRPKKNQWKNRKKQK